ncbi:MAG: DUF2254 domain-containing protein [Bacteroidetes bacterium]|nr:DUF2254 domain-containing protein [Bacteroidota bacterium]
MEENLKYFFQKLTSKLWFRPLIFCLISIGIALLGHLADNSFLVDIVPVIEKKSLENLLTNISASMLVIAIFAVGSMISAYSAATGTATPRSFKLIVADDVSQNALSVYIGSFIFSIVASVALRNEYYGQAGTFTLFILTLFVFAVVILTFLRWVERISKLGRLGHTIKKIEEVTFKALENRIDEPYLGGVPQFENAENGIPVFADKVGYVQYIYMSKLQSLAKHYNVTITIKCIPGVFVSDDKPIAYIHNENNLDVVDKDKIIKAFSIDNSRSFVYDPRFGLIALSEISSRALSPAINDPGTAIAIIGSHVRLFTFWLKALKENKKAEIKYDKIHVPIIALDDMFEDAFRPIARDGANNIEVMLRLQKAFISLSHAGNSEAKEIAAKHSRAAFERAELAMTFKSDLEILKSECLFIKI